MDGDMDFVLQHAPNAPSQSLPPSLTPPPVVSQPTAHHQRHQLQYQQSSTSQQPQVRQCPYFTDPLVSGPPPSHQPHFSPHHGHSPSHFHHPNSSPSQPPAAQAQNFFGLTHLTNRTFVSQPYDPVHSSVPDWHPSNTRSPSYHHWPAVATLPPPRPSLDFYSFTDNMSSTSARGAGAAGGGSNGTGNGNSNSIGSDGASNGGNDGRRGDGLDLAPSTGLLQPPAGQNQQTPRQEAFTPTLPGGLPYQSTGFLNANSLPAASAPPSQSQQSGQHINQQQNLIPSSRPSTLESGPARFPALVPPVLPRPTQPQLQQQQHSHTGGAVPRHSAVPDSSRSGPVFLPQGTIPHRGPAELSRNRHFVSDMTQAAGSGAEAGTSFGTQPRAPNMVAAGSSARPSDSSEYDSEEEAEDERERLGMIDHFGNRIGGGVTEGRIRQQQLLRGQMSTKRVVSKEALASLQSVKVDDLPKNERTCIICYNDFGVQNPEGMIEAPLRLPKCKHVFGDHCIKKWFKDSDSCPYCRDKLPSEHQYRLAGTPQSARSLQESLQAQTAAIRAYMGGGGSSPYLAMPGSGNDASRPIRTPGSGADLSPTRTAHDRRASQPSESQEQRRRTAGRPGHLIRGPPGASDTAATRASTRSQPVSFDRAQQASASRSRPVNDHSTALHQQSPSRNRFPDSSGPPGPSVGFRSQPVPHADVWQSYLNFQGNQPPLFGSYLMPPPAPGPGGPGQQQRFQNYMPTPAFSPQQHGNRGEGASHPQGSGTAQGHAPQQLLQPPPNGYGSDATYAFGYNLPGLQASLDMQTDAQAISTGSYP